MSNIFSKIANAPKSAFLAEVEQLREQVATVHAIGALTEVKVANAEPIIIWMRRGHEGSDFTYLVTDGEVTEGSDHYRQHIVTGGSFTLEIIEAMKQIVRVIVHVRRGFDANAILDEVRGATATRYHLRSVSKGASDDTRTVAMVIKQLN